MSAIKEEAIRLVENLPEQATWDDIMYEFYVKQKISLALEAAEKGDVLPHEKVKTRFSI